MEEIETVRFAVVVDGEVVSNVAYENTPPLDGLVAILRTGPTFVEIPQEVAIGSTWDGKRFAPPTKKKK